MTKNYHKAQFTGIVKLITICNFLFLGSPIFSQQLTNIRVTQENDLILILYDIPGGHPGQVFSSSLTLIRKNNPGFKIVPSSLKGDFQEVTPGFNKKIIWDATADVDILEGDDYIFELTLEEVTNENEFKKYGMVFIQGGTFQMGCTNEQTHCFEDERPIHSVTLNSYYLSKYEVTQSLWQELMGANPSNFKNENHPVENVSWHDAQEFIVRLNKKSGKNFRLPTEAEWEFAARGGVRSEKYLFSGSNSITEVGWYNGNGSRTTHQVGTKLPNELGLFDMTGNVLEWCSDGNGRYPDSHQINPLGNKVETDKIVRGGGWFSDAKYCRNASRDCKNAGSRFSSLGFRLAHPAN